MLRDVQAPVNGAFGRMRCGAVTFRRMAVGIALIMASAACVTYTPADLKTSAAQRGFTDRIALRDDFETVRARVYNGMMACLNKPKDQGLELVKGVLLTPALMDPSLEVTQTFDAAAKRAEITTHRQAQSLRTVIVHAEIRQEGPETIVEDARVDMFPRLVRFWAEGGIGCRAPMRYCSTSASPVAEIWRQRFCSATE